MNKNYTLLFALTMVVMTGVMFRLSVDSGLNFSENGFLYGFLFAMCGMLYVLSYKLEKILEEIKEDDTS